MNKSESIAALAAALTKAQGAVRVAQKNRRNPHLKNDYSDLSAIWQACRAALSSNGIAAIQQVTAADGQRVAITTLLTHSSGEWIELGPLEVPVQKFDAQGVGSAISYGKRYALSAAVGVVSGEEDDDGEQAVNESQTQSPEESALLTMLREAALNGPDALSAAFSSVPKSQHKAAVWANYGASLKAAANAAVQQ